MEEKHEETACPHSFTRQTTRWFLMRRLPRLSHYTVRSRAKGCVERCTMYLLQRAAMTVTRCVTRCIESKPAISCGGRQGDAAAAWKRFTLVRGIHVGRVLARPLHHCHMS